MSSPVELASLLQVAGKIELGNKCDVWRGQVIVARNRRTLEAYIKHLPPRAIFIETIAAQIGRSLGLPIPRPLLVKVEPVRLPQLKLERPAILFGSEDARYPSLQRFVPLQSAIEELKKWPWAIKAGCFDEWIANTDRHQGNILYQGNGTFSLIDHSHAVPESFSPLAAIKHNSMLQIVSPLPSDELGIHRKAKEARKVLPKFLELAEQDWLNITQSSAYCDPDDAKKIISFLNDRLEVLSILIGSQIGERQQDLYATSEK